MLLSRFYRLISTYTFNLGAQLKQLNDQKKFQQAIALFDKHDLNQRSTTLATNQALRACIELGHLKHGKDIHKSLSNYLVNDDYVRTNLLRLYTKAKEIFGQKVSKPVALYAAILNGLLENNRAQEAFDLFQRLKIEPNEYIFTIGFKTCSQLANEGALKFGKNLLHTMPSRFQNNPVILTSALHMFVRCDDLSSAEELFSRIEKNIVTYGAMMALSRIRCHKKAMDLFAHVSKPNEFIYSIFFKACAQLGNIEGLTQAKQIYSQLPTEYRRSSRVMESVLNMFTKCDDQSSAESLFNQVQRRVICYGSMMKMYNAKREPEKTLALWKRMKQEKIESDGMIFTLLIDACSQIGDYDLCQSIVRRIPRHIMIDPWIQNGLIDMWGKVGSAEEAKRIFDGLDRPSNISFTAMINAFGLNGKGREAVQLFRQVPINQIDSWIYVCVLNACSHSGLSDEGQEIFNSIPPDRRTEQIYTIIIDTFSRLFSFNTAQNLLDEYEQNHPPSLPMHMAILSGARNQKNASLSQKIFDRVQSLFPNAKLTRTSVPILLANTYASQANLPKASDIRTQINQSGVKKVTGLSWTVVDGKIAKFRAHDRSHSHSDKIHIESERMFKELVNHGYKCDASWVTRPLMNDETPESNLCGHSERLAIAYHFIRGRTPSRIQIVQNLRICGDCHTAIKLIAKIR